MKKITDKIEYDDALVEAQGGIKCQLDCPMYIYLNKDNSGKSDVVGGPAVTVCKCMEQKLPAGFSAQYSVHL